MILLQKEIIEIITGWVVEHNKPIPLTEIVQRETTRNPRTIRASAETLCRKGYLRRSCERGLTAYILLRK